VLVLVRSWSVARRALSAPILVVLATAGCSAEGTAPATAVGSAASALIVGQQATLSVGVPGAQLGGAVSLSGDTALVGATGANAAYVFVRSGTTWAEQAMLVGSDTVAADELGYSVSLSGDTAVVGSRSHAAGAGAAYVFVRSGTTWTQEAKLTAADGARNDQFASSVAVSGDLAVVGAPGKSCGTGVAYAFARTGTTWAQEAEWNLGCGQADGFGWSVSVSGDTAIVGIPQDGFGAGYVQVFVRTGTTWAEQDALGAADGAKPPPFLPFALTDDFGWAVSLSGDTAIVGAPGNGGAGAAYVFTRTGTTWAQVDKLVDSDAAGLDRFGQSVSVAGDIAVVGAPLRASVAAAYFFLGGGTRWTQGAKLLSPGSGGPDAFGTGVSVSPDTAVFGAPGASGSSTPGAAYVFTGFQRTQGEGCNTASECVSGLCVDGVCCDTACGGGSTTDCQACSKAAGAAMDGTCGPVVCVASDQCHTAGTCTNGVCDNPLQVDGTPCSDGNACTLADTCQGGTCASGSPTLCMPIDQCHLAGTCVPATGLCTNPARSDGAACDDGDPATPVDHCETGACLGGPLVPWSWVPVAPLLEARAGHTATRLPSGKVFVTGGFAGITCVNDSWVPLQSSEIYDPVQDAWTAVAPSAARHPGTNAVLLPDGRVLVADLSATTPSEIYDPATDSWTTRAPAPSSDPKGTRAFSRADGKVMAFGTSTGLAAVYDPVLDHWAPAAPWPGSIDALVGAIDAMLLLGDGRIFALGAQQYAVYDPATDHWTAPATPSVFPDGGPPALLHDGRVVLPGPSSSAVYDPATDTWRPAGPTLPPSLSGAGAPSGVVCSISFYGEMPALLGGGRLALLGGEETIQCSGPGGTICSRASANVATFNWSQVFDAAALTWSAGATLATARGLGAVTPLDGGEILVTGGVWGGCSETCGNSTGEGVLAAAEIYKRGASLESPCALGTDCASGICAGGVCVVGMCKACSVGADCVTGFCVGGACCDTASGGGSLGECLACDKAAGAAGTCDCGAAGGSGAPGGAAWLAVVAALLGAGGGRAASRRTRASRGGPWRSATARRDAAP
jgi:hypothetical protein